MTNIEKFFDENIGFDNLEKEFDVVSSNVEYVEAKDKVKFKIVNYLCDPNAKILLFVVIKPKEMRMAEWNFADKDDVSESLNSKDFRWSNKNDGPVNGLFYEPSVLKEILKGINFEGNKYYKE